MTTKRSYHYSRKQKAKIAARQAERRAEAQLEKARKELKKKQAKVQSKREKVRAKNKAVQDVAAVIDGNPNKNSGNLVTEEKLGLVPPTLKEAVHSEMPIIFKPHPGPQTAFLAATETEVLYGGAAGGGKSYAMIVDPLRYAHNKNMRALLIRKTMPELLELIDESRKLYPLAFPGAKFNEQQKRWMFPSGATLQFSFVDSDQDVYRFYGQAYTWIGVDELGHYNSPYVWDSLRSRLRRTDMSIIPYMRATANPGGRGGWWLKKMFTEPAKWNESFWACDTETGKILRYPDIDNVEPELRGKPLFRRRFIPALLTDNPTLMQSPEYMAMLASLPETKRRQLLEGDWDAVEDCAFEEFNKKDHVVDQFTPPLGWTRFRACDYGYVDYAAVLWLAMDYWGTLYVYRELYSKGMDAGKLAEEILEIEAREPRRIQGVLDTNAWETRGLLGPTIAETMISMGVEWVKADKGPGSRINGKIELHRRLAVNAETGKPGLLISSACKNLIRTIPLLPLDPIKPEDVDTKFKEDHLYDALRYGVMSRFASYTPHPEELMFQKDTEENFQPSDEVFGY